MQDAAAETDSSTEFNDTWPTTTARVMSVLGLVGLALSIILAAAQYFEVAGLIAALTIVVVGGYVCVATGFRTDKESAADIQAASSGYVLSFILVLVALLVARLRNGYDEPLIIPVALLQNGIPILLAPTLAMPLAFRAWRKRPDRP